eukprot:4186761-Amphidinium_carterae.1
MLLRLASDVGFACHLLRHTSMIRRDALEMETYASWLHLLTACSCCCRGVTDTHAIHAAGYCSYMSLSGNGTDLAVEEDEEDLSPVLYKGPGVVIQQCDAGRSSSFAAFSLHTCYQQLPELRVHMLKARKQ